MESLIDFVSLTDGVRGLATFLPSLETTVKWLSWMIIAVGLTQNIIYAWNIPMAWREIREHSQRNDTQTAWDLLTSKDAMAISIVVPAYNEGPTIIESVRALLGIQYPNFEIIIVNDGSADTTLDLLIKEFALTPVTRARDRNALDHAPIRAIYTSEVYPELIVVDKENGGKADAANAGLTCVRTPLFAVIDADSILEPEALLIATRPFMESANNVVAVGGTVGIANGCAIRKGRVVKYGLPRRFLARIQVVEYNRAFLMARLAASRSGTLALISGAFGIFRRDLAMAVGGFDRTTLGEDMEMVLRLHRHMIAKGEPYEIRYVPEPVCWTEAPETLKILSRQRVRWQRGALECLQRHRVMIFNPKYKRIGLIAMPLILLIDLVGPIVETLGYLLIPFFAFSGLISMDFFFAYMALVFLFGVFLSTMSVLLEQAELERVTSARDILNLALTAVFENFGYRQLCNYWRIKGVILHMRGKKAVWEAMPRIGFRQAS